MKGVGLFRSVTLLACLAVAATAAAQFGHPLKGSWSGDWGPNKNDRTHVLIEIKWDGKALTGTLNPGADGAPLQNLTLNTGHLGHSFRGRRQRQSGENSPLRRRREARKHRCLRPLHHRHVDARLDEG